MQTSPQKHTVLALALALTSLDESKRLNRPFREVMIWEDACETLAARARTRILYFALQFSIHSMIRPS